MTWASQLLARIVSEFSRLVSLQKKMEDHESTMENDLYYILKPVIEKINAQVSAVRLSQVCFVERY